jgi:hypothetical protein
MTSRVREPMVVVPDGDIRAHQNVSPDHYGARRAKTAVTLDMSAVAYLKATEAAIGWRWMALESEVMAYVDTASDFCVSRVG